VDLVSLFVKESAYGEVLVAAVGLGNLGNVLGGDDAIGIEVVDEADYLVAPGNEHVHEHPQALYALIVRHLCALAHNVRVVDEARVHHWVRQVVVRSDVVGPAHHLRQVHIVYHFLLVKNQKMKHAVH